MKTANLLVHALDKSLAQNSASTRRKGPPCQLGEKARAQKMKKQLGGMQRP